METKDLIIVNEDDREMISGLPKVFENLMTAHSEFQILNFILNDIDFPTVPGKYHQSVRELWSRYNNIISLTYEYKKIENEIKIHEINKLRLAKRVESSILKLDILEIDVHIDQEELEIAHKNMRLGSIKKNGDESIREMKVLVKALKILDSLIGPKLRSENGLPDREKSELGFWMQKQFMAEQIHCGDRKMTPFNKIFGLKQGQVPTIGVDTLGRAVILSKVETEAIGNTDKPVKLIGGNNNE